MNEYLQGIDDDKSRGGPYEVRGADALLLRPRVRGANHNGADVSSPASFPARDESLRAPHAEKIVMEIQG